MNYLLAEGLTKIYGDKVLFKDVNVSINKGQKVALVAKNGAGKSSLLSILVGLDSSDEAGWVRVHKDVKMCYAAQTPDLRPEDTVMEAIFYSDNPTLKAIRTYNAVLTAQENNPNPKNADALTKAMEKMQVLDAWDYEAKIKQILAKLNITRLEQKIEKLSGGERKRVALAGILVQEPDFIIMDEPTNHLDLEMIEWLEEYLNRTNLTLLLVTHDRYFLNRVTTEILELDRGILQKFKGNYEYYLEKKEELTFNLKQETNKAQKLMKKELQWINTQPKARTTKSKSRIDAFDKIVDKANTKVTEDALGFADIKMARVGSKTVEMQYVSKAYGDRTLFKDFHYFFKRRDRVGIVGRNGAGKSTLLNMLVGNEKPDSGKVVIGKTVVFGYYTQKGLQIKEDRCVIDFVRDVAEYLPLEKGKQLSAAQLLDRFQFPYSKHQNRISTLSGGELRRLYLLTILMTNPNFLILDEPTNDLDLLTLNVLEEFLIHFKGCLVIVTHDRYFMDKLVDHVFVFEGNGKMRDYPGNYTQYRAAKEKEIKEQRAEKNSQPTPKKQKEKSTVSTTKKKLSYHEKKEYGRLEGEIEKLEEEKEALEEKFNNNAGSYDEMMKWSKRMEEIIEQIDTKSDRWLELSEFM